MKEPTIKEKIYLLKELKNLMKQLEELENDTCFDNYFSSDFQDKYFSMSNDINFEIDWLENEEIKPIENNIVATT